MNLCQFIVSVEGLKTDKGFYNLSNVPWTSNQMNPTPLHISSTKCVHFPVNRPNKGKMQ